ncbi:MAG: hypothetical protein JJU11_02415 [Candidatus Sumerlaeia bacterium]|nr:hypothetical protein [Candidatus Sumerlaeia bacterium]
MPKLIRYSAAAVAILTMFVVGDGRPAVPMEGEGRRLSTNELIDLHELIQSVEGETSALVPLGPRIAAGQGPHGTNQTVIRVFDQYGALENQFLAYRGSITGGVHVVAGPVLGGETLLVTAPIASSATREIRLFHQDGRLAGAFEPDGDLAAPFTLAVGNFDPERNGHEIAVMGANRNGTESLLIVYTGTGEELSRHNSPLVWNGSPSAVTLTRVPAEYADVLLVHQMDDQLAAFFEPRRELSEMIDIASLPGDALLHPSALSGEYLLAGGHETLLSTVHHLDDNGTISSIDAGARENHFWVHPVDSIGKRPEGYVYTFDTYPEGWTGNTSLGLIPGEGRLKLQFLESEPFDPHMFSPLGDRVDADQFDEFAIRLRVENASAPSMPGRVFFFPVAGGLGIVDFNIDTTTSDWQTIRLNMNTDRLLSHDAWQGEMFRLRLDIPEDGQPYSTHADTAVEIDWFAFTADPTYEPVRGLNAISGEYVSVARYRHLRTDASTNAYGDEVGFEIDDPEEFFGQQFDDFLLRSFNDYYVGLPNAWNPTFSHRQFPGFFDAWIDHIDPETGLNRFASLTRTNETSDYLEVGTTFRNMTYAPGIPELDRLKVWPLRSFLQELAVHHRQDPSRTVSVEPNHEFEIEVTADNTIGDYNPAMIEAFRDWLYRRYAGLPQINARFNVSFPDRESIDPPRNDGRGSWDAYSLDNPYYLAWEDFLRSVVNHNIALGMRESLLAGLPPEIIKTHQIPANFAVGPIINGRRVTPIDWSMTTGTGFGVTQFGLWYNQPVTWLTGATSSGHTQNVMGEYQPLTTDLAAATSQIRHTFNNGIKFLHHLTWVDPSADQNLLDGWNNTAQQAILNLVEDIEPRPMTTGGIGQIRPVIHLRDTPEEQRYNIVQIGSGQETAGLLKSITHDGDWEGTIYLTPFHQALTVDVIENETSRLLTTDQYVTPSMNNLYSGDVIEVRFLARTNDADGKVTLLTLHDGTELPGSRMIWEVGEEWRSYRYAYMIQERMDPMMILINSGERDTASGGNQSIELDQFSVTVQRRNVARIEYGIDSGQPHRGGVRFDLLSPTHVPESLDLVPFAPPSSVSDWTGLAVY